MSRLTFLDLGGKRVLHLDYSHLGTEEEMLATISEATRLIAAQPPRSMHTLTDVTGSRATEKVIEALKASTRNNRTFVVAGAVVGLRPVQRLIYSAVMKFSGRQLAAFDTMEEAKAWLRGQPL